MQADYPKKYPTRSWDPLRIEYPVRKFPDTGVSSETIARKCRGLPEVIQKLKTPVHEIKQYDRDYNVSKDFMQSESTLKFGIKQSESHRFNKHTSWIENQYIYPPSRRLTDQPPQCSAHGTTEMRSAYSTPTVAPRLVTNKDQYKHPASLPQDPPMVEPSWHKELESLDTTYEGFEKYLDPYLTTSRLHHRPYTADQLSRPSASKDIITFYTFANVPWVRTPKTRECRLPISMPKPMSDKEKFKQHFREIITHNKPACVPGAFRTESRDNYAPSLSRPKSTIHNIEEDVRTYYERSLANLPNISKYETSVIRDIYTNTENSHVGSGRPICSAVDQYLKKNKRLELKNGLLR